MDKGPEAEESDGDLGMTPETKSKLEAMVDNYLRSSKISEDKLLDFMEKGLPKPFYGDADEPLCPTCDGFIDDTYPHCPHCGQLIDWEQEYVADWLKKEWEEEA